MPVIFWAKQVVTCACCTTVWSWRLPRFYRHHGVKVWYCFTCEVNGCERMYQLGHSVFECNCPVPLTEMDEIKWQQ